MRDSLARHPITMRRQLHRSNAILHHILSIIVPAHDEAALIGDTLVSMRTAAETLRLDHEIIVVDGACTDATAPIATANDARLLHLAHRQIAATRNTQYRCRSSARQPPSGC